MIVLDADHRRRVPSALHDDRRRRRHLLADGAHLRVRDRRRDPARADADAGARVAKLVAVDDRGDEEHNWLMRALNRFYTPLFDFALRSQARRRARVGSCRSSLVLRARRRRSAREFMPKLEEGNFWIRATLPTSISLEQSAKYVGRMRAILRGCPARPRATPCDDANRAAPRGRRRSSRSSAAPTTAPTSPASTTSSSSRRSSRSTSGGTA